MAKEKIKSMEFVLDDLERPARKMFGIAWIENGQLLIKLEGHGNQSEEGGPIVALQYDMEIARLTVFRDINSEEPTESMDLDGALEKNRS
jgi:hypothetical protein